MPPKALIDSMMAALDTARLRLRAKRDTPKNELTSILEELIPSTLHEPHWQAFVCSFPCQLNGGGPPAQLMARFLTPGASRTLLGVACKNLLARHMIVSEQLSARRPREAGGDEGVRTAATAHLSRLAVHRWNPVELAAVVETEADEHPLFRSSTHPAYYQVVVTAVAVPGVEAADLEKMLQFVAFLTAGGGALWLWSSVVAVELPLDPDCERAVQNVLREACRLLGILFSCRPDLLDQNHSALGHLSIRRPPRLTLSVSDLCIADVRALQGLIIVIGKGLRQANPTFLPL
jgi:hypothetical protein